MAGVKTDTVPQFTVRHVPKAFVEFNFQFADEMRKVGRSRTRSTIDFVCAARYDVDNLVIYAANKFIYLLLITKLSVIIHLRACQYALQMSLVFEFGMDMNDVDLSIASFTIYL